MTVACTHCEKQATLFFRTKDHNQHSTNEWFSYHRCSSCGLIFLSPVPDDLGLYYTKEYPAYQMPQLKELEAKAEQELYKIQLVQTYLTEGNLLEIGPSYGAFAYLAKKAGFDVETIERDADCCKYLSEVVGVTAIESDNAAQALLGRGPYHAVVLWHVIEHLADPWDTLRAIAGKLRPGGFLVMTSPNPSAIQFRIFKRHWIHVDAPRHLQLIPAPLLSDFMRPLGMELIQVTTRDRASTLFHTFGWWGGSFRIMVKDLLNGFRGERDVVRHQKNSMGYLRISGRLINVLTFIFRVIKMAFTVGARLLLFIVLKPFERVEGRGSAYTIVLRKR